MSWLHQDGPLRGIRCSRFGRKDLAVRDSRRGRARCLGRVRLRSRSLRGGRDEPFCSALGRVDSSPRSALAHGEDVCANRDGHTFERAAEATGRRSLGIETFLRPTIHRNGRWRLCLSRHYQACQETQGLQVTAAAGDQLRSGGRYSPPGWSAGIAAGIECDTENATSLIPGRIDGQLCSDPSLQRRPPTVDSGADSAELPSCREPLKPTRFAFVFSGEPQQPRRQTTGPCNRYILGVEQVTYRQVPWKMLLPTATLPFNFG